jgi:hypothetical protein
MRHHDAYARLLAVFLKFNRPEDPEIIDVHIFSSLLSDGEWYMNPDFEAISKSKETLKYILKLLNNAYNEFKEVTTCSCDKMLSRGLNPRHTWCKAILCYNVQCTMDYLECHWNY